jgi:hypothetical protein
VASGSGHKRPSRFFSEVREIGVTFNPGVASVRPGEMFARARYGFRVES